MHEPEMSDDEANVSTSYRNYISETDEDEEVSENVIRDSDENPLSDDDVSPIKRNHLKNRNVILSSSEEESSDGEAVAKDMNNIPSAFIESRTSDNIEDGIIANDPDLSIISSKLEKSTLLDDSSEVENIGNDHSPSNLGKNRMSQNFERNANILCSTFINSNIMTPKHPDSGKRLLNKSSDTPKTFKMTKESNTPRHVTQGILSSSEESDEENEDVIEVSDDETVQKPQKTLSKTTKQTTLLELFKNEIPMEEKKLKQGNPDFEEVSSRQYEEQAGKVRRLQEDFQRASDLLRKINLEHLPDKGESLKNRRQHLEQVHMEEVLKLSRMKIAQGDTKSGVLMNSDNQIKTLSWDEIEAATKNVVPKTFGKKAMSTYNTQKALTIERLQQLHGSLETCPKESDLEEPPKGLKVELMVHQLRALRWLMWREKQKPSGGILGDDMGLGKTLTMISLMLKCNEIEKDEDSDDEEENAKKYKGGTLIICPASLINQWSGELERRTQRGLASCEIYHGSKRETKPKRLTQHDMVVTTYSIVNVECEKNGAVFGVKWRRIILDEAHQIRNHKSQTCDAVCRLHAKSRWALSGTPVQNKELDMYSLLKFLRCSPFDELPVWKRWVGDRSSGGSGRLHTVISSLMLRRTKAELIEKGLLNTMPERKWELIPVELTKSERDIYSKILIFSRTLFAQFLHQRAEKNQDLVDDGFIAKSTETNGPNQEYFRMRQKLLKMNKLRDVKQHEILVLLLRLRQICCHPSLITGMLHEDTDLLGDEDNTDSASALDLLDQLNKLTISDGSEPPEAELADVAEGLSEDGSSLKDAARHILKPSDPVFSKSRMSSKIEAVIKLLRERVLISDDKAIIVSQWPTFLDLIAYHLKEEGIIFDKLDGKVPVPKRMDMVDRFNNPKDKMRILLLSLTAGGVGLNLVGANHLILLDLHWNPQLENQAQDRIYRVGQTKPVFVYKFMATETIEKRILNLQEKKLEIADSMLTGTIQARQNKLSLQDLKLLFEM